MFQADNNEPFKDSLDPRLFEFDNSDSVELRTISKWQSKTASTLADLLLVKLEQERETAKMGCYEWQLDMTLLFARSETEN